MLTVKELKELQEYCDTLSMTNIHDILNQLLYGIGGVESND